MLSEIRPSQKDKQCMTKSCKDRRQQLPRTSGRGKWVVANEWAYSSIMQSKFWRSAIVNNTGFYTEENDAGRSPITCSYRNKIDFKNKKKNEKLTYMG